MPRSTCLQLLKREIIYEFEILHLGRQELLFLSQWIVMKYM